MISILIDTTFVCTAGARSATKQFVRKDALSWLIENREFDLQVFLGYLEQPQVQKGLDLYVQSLKTKSKI